MFIGSGIRITVKGWWSSTGLFIKENLESRKELS